MNSNKKAQGAMEYLMTYGWAILIVIIVAAALFALGVFNPGTYTQQAATGFGDFNVPTGGFQLTPGGVLTLQLTNGVGADIWIKESWTVIGTTRSPNSSAINNNANLAPGQTATITFTTLGTRTSGNAYTATVNITYINQNTGLNFTTSGTLTGSVS